MGEFDNSYLAGIVRNDRVRFAAVVLLNWENESWRQSLDEVVANKELAGLRIPHGALEGNPEFCHAAASSGLILLVDTAPGSGLVWLGSPDSCATPSAVPWCCPISVIRSSTLWVISRTMLCWRWHESPTFTC